jgi:hypothetical protein
VAYPDKVATAAPWLEFCVVQYYIPDWDSRLHQTGRRLTFGEKTFPTLSSG